MELKKEDIEILDYMLNLILKGNIVTFDTNRKLFQGKDSAAKSAEYEHYVDILVRYNCCKVVQKGYNSMIKSDASAFDIQRSGGFAAIYEQQQSIKTKNAENENLLYKKLSLEIENLKNQVKDYPKAVERANRSFIIAVLAVVVSIIALFV